MTFHWFLTWINVHFNANTKADVFRSDMTVLFDPYSVEERFHVHRGAVISSFQRFLFQVATTSTSGTVDVCIDPRARDRPVSTLYRAVVEVTGTRRDLRHATRPMTRDAVLGEAKSLRVCHGTHGSSSRYPHSAARPCGRSPH